MATFIMTGKYSTDSLRQISAQRSGEANEIVRQCGGSISAAYATMGEADLLVITEFPAVEQAIQASVALSKALDISFATIPAITVADFDTLVGEAP